LTYKIYNVFLLLVLSCLFIFPVSAQQTAPERAGLRSSVYGFNSFPDTVWWYNATTDMSNRFPGSAPSVIWILGYTDNDGCYVDFPNPNPGTQYPNIYFSDFDRSEAYLDYFDKQGTKVWLQIEPGFADILTVINLALTHYGHHACIIGFGIDVEWYRTSAANNYEGDAVTDSAAQAWSEKVRSFNENYLLFTKHWMESKMPPSYRKGMVFIDDSQQFNGLSGMVTEFTNWAKHFAPSKVGFQFGYEEDKKWWGKLSNPPADIGKALLSKCTNIADLYWVDFSAYDIWPADFRVDVNEAGIRPDKFTLYPNYPNPFNPSTTIKFSLAGSGIVQLAVYNILGEKVTTLIDKTDLSAGIHSVQLNMQNEASGIYLLILKQGSAIQTQKIVLMK
jgi:hypothetical protein